MFSVKQEKFVLARIVDYGDRIKALEDCFRVLLGNYGKNKSDSGSEMIASAIPEGTPAGDPLGGKERAGGFDSPAVSDA